MRAVWYPPVEYREVTSLEQEMVGTILRIARYKRVPTEEELAIFHNLERRYISLYNQRYSCEPPFLPSKGAARFVKHITRAANGTRVTA